MNQTHSFLKSCFVAIWIVLMVPGASVAQVHIDPADNPNVDQIPLELLQRSQQETDAAPLSSVITINNWDNFNLGVDFAEGNITADPNDPVRYFTAYNIDKPHHTEDGYSWFTTYPTWGATMRGDPVQTHDSLGNLYYENMYGSGSIVGCKVAVSYDNGATWANVENAISGGDKNWIAADQTAGPYSNYVYTTMTSTSYNSGSLARSTDFGQTWTTTFTTGTQSLPGMMPCVGAYQNIQGGAVYVVANGGNGFAPTYTFFRSLDGGSTFTQMSSQQFAGYVGTDVGGRHSVQNMRTRPYPFIAADNSYGPNRGRLYCVYASNDPPGNGNKPDIWSRYSDNGGTTWSAAKRVNDDANPTQHHQWHPAIWCDKETGRLYIQWMDTRDTPTSDSALIYATYSDDGGVTYVENQAISNKKMKIDCSSCGGGGTPRYEGDYNGIVSNNKVAMANWSDFRNGNFMSATAYFPDFAMAISKTMDTVCAYATVTNYSVSVPDVKLYDDTVVVSATVNPVPSAGTITFVYPNGEEITTFPGACTVELHKDDQVPAGLYQVIFQANGPNGTPVHRRTMSLKVLDALGSPGPVSGPDQVCADSVAGYSISTVPNADSYSWTVPENATILSGQNTTSISVQWGGTSGTVSVIAGNICGISTPGTIDVDVSSPPSAPGAILGPDIGCTGIETIFNIAEVPGAESYEWSVPADAQITAGQGTTEITVLWGTTPGEISVFAQNACGMGLPSHRTLAVGAIPQPAGAITGNDTVCVNHTGYVYSVEEIGAASHYVWTLPEGASIVEGQGTREVTLFFSQTAASGDISVYGENDCGEGAPSSKSVIVSECAGLAENDLLADVRLYPNPANGTLHLQIRGKEKNINLAISDATGKVKITETLSDIAPDYSKNIDVSDMPEGLYVIRMSNDGRSYTAKFVIQR